MRNEPVSPELALAEALARCKSVDPLLCACAQLCLGERLRRLGRRLEAREHLGDALETFMRSGAQVWADRARAELAASVETTRKGDCHLDELTPQERQVALVVAHGGTNREAAAELFLSTKTIEFHLRNAYRKLGVRTRTHLANVLLREDLAA